MALPALRSGKVITFYSYKGGTGRSMALSNMAWVLASNGLDVLVIDWDLEAPGLHRYLRPFLVNPELTSTPGLIDFLWDTVSISVTPAGSGDAPSPQFPSLEDYIVGVDWRFKKGGSLSFLPAGRQDQNYARRVNTFDWNNFYERLGGGKLLHAERDALRKNYDYILIDSRTGVSDTAGICTVQLPDMLVVLFTLNRQGILGASAVAASVQEQRGSAFRIFPVPTRIENAEADRRDTALAFARRIFAPCLGHVQKRSSPVDPTQQIPYWSDVETPYKTFYAFEEVPAPFRDQQGRPGEVLASTERLAARLTDRVVTKLAPETEKERRKVIAAYAFDEPVAEQSESAASKRGPSPVVRLALLASRPEMRRALAFLVALITSIVAVGSGLQIFLERRSSAQLQSQLEQAAQKLQASQQALNNYKLASDAAVTRLQLTDSLVANIQANKTASSRDLNFLRSQLKATNGVLVNGVVSADSEDKARIAPATPP